MTLRDQKEVKHPELAKLRITGWIADLRGCFVSSLLRLMSSLRSSIDLVLSITNDDIQLDFSSAESAFMMMRG